MTTLECFKKNYSNAVCKANEIQNESASDQQSKSNKMQQTLFVATESQLSKHAEMMLGVELMMCKQSFFSCDNKSNLLSAMFPDSSIAYRFAYVQLKCRYIVFWDSFKF